MISRQLGLKLEFMYLHINGWSASAELNSQKLLKQTNRIKDTHVYQNHHPFFSDQYTNKCSFKKFKSKFIDILFTLRHSTTYLTIMCGISITSCVFYHRQTKLWIVQWTKMKDYLHRQKTGEGKGISESVSSLKTLFSIVATRLQRFTSSTAYSLKFWFTQ